ncbi:MAG TPA: hypothetical protein VD866_24520 [Urbifossiella sp.]|nr:hypothetical protein [Urbifossiella sp.]
MVVATLYAVSFGLPAVVGFGGSLMPGWEAFAYGAFLLTATVTDPASWTAVTDPASWTDRSAVPIVACWLANIWVPLGVVWLARDRPREAGLRGTFGAAHTSLAVWLWWDALPQSLGPGYYAWAGSAVALAVAGWTLACFRLRRPAQGSPSDQGEAVDPTLRSVLGLSPTAGPRLTDR